MLFQRSSLGSLLAAGDHHAKVRREFLNSFFLSLGSLSFFLPRGQSSIMISGEVRRGRPRILGELGSISPRTSSRNWRTWGPISSEREAVEELKNALLEELENVSLVRESLVREAGSSRVVGRVLEEVENGSSIAVCERSR